MYQRKILLAMQAPYRARQRHSRLKSTHKLETMNVDSVTFGFSDSVFMCYVYLCVIFFLTLYNCVNKKFQYMKSKFCRLKNV